MSILVHVVQNEALPDWFQGARNVQVQTPTKTPSGKPGRIHGHDCRYMPSKQEWIDCGSYWLGVWKGKLANPADYIRKDAAHGHQVTLADGQSWLIPVARRVIGTPPVESCRMQYVDGKWQIGQPTERMRLLWELACGCWDQILGSDGKSVDIISGTEAAAAAIMHNYHLDNVAISALGLLDGVSAVEVMKAMVDWPSIAAIAEKKTDAMPSGEHGESD